MPTVASFDREKSEVQAVLSSGIFNRAPNLEHLLTYVCSKYFEGAAEEIKEYNIAVEALGRPPEFDQKRDSIVRVEAHRLRKRLREYYEGEGAGHAVHIQIPSGQYTPHFVFVAAPPEETEALQIIQELEPVSPSTETALTTNCEELPLSAEEPRKLPEQTFATPPLPKPAPPRHATWWRWVLAAAGLAVLGLLGFVALRERNKPPARIVELVPAPDAHDDIRILCGVENGSYVDAFERTWLSDRFFSGGYVSQTPRVHPILGTRDQRLYQTRREGGFKYDIPLKPGVYELKLYFAETVYGDNNVAGGGETTRMFVVDANGKRLLNNFDVISDAGAAVADIKVFKDISPGPDGKLHLEFQPETNPAFVNAIEILPAVAGKIRPIRIVARDRGFKDSQGRYWDPDRYAQGGQLISRPESTVKDGEPEMYRSERFGNITYTIPVAQPGRYGVNLYFTENWFGPGMPGGGGVGDRAFDILINGVAVKRNFDIFKEAGGTGKASIVTLHDVEANHQGKIVISLPPARNYACINALEIVDETR